MRSVALAALVIAAAFAMGCSGPRLARSQSVANAPFSTTYRTAEVANAAPSSRTYLGYVPAPPPPPAISNFRPATRAVSTPVRAAATTRYAPRSYTPSSVSAPAPVRRTVRRPARKTYRMPVSTAFTDKDCNT